MINEHKKNCCDCEEIPTTLKLSLKNKVLWVTVNNVTAGVNLASLSTGGGGGGDSGTPVELLIPVTSNGQTLFSQVIPEDATVTDLIINGVNYTQEGGSFDVEDTDVIWTGPFELNITHTVVLKLWQL